jgi:microsomal dipeptidase-like Zn-dependent dipeptidase
MNRPSLFGGDPGGRAALSPRAGALGKAGRGLRRLAAVLLAGGAAAAAQAQPVTGYVDLHSHLMAEHSFGGGWFWGTADGAMSTAVRRCDGNIARSHAATRFPGLSEFLGADTGWHLGRRNGFDTRRCTYIFGIPVPGSCPEPHFRDWPSWDGIAHQQMWKGWLQAAHQGGLRVMVVSLAESNFLCINTAPETRRYDCDEMASVARQAGAAATFAANNHTWVGIAASPAQARQLIGQGKLALVLAVEVTRLFPAGDFVAQLDALRALGVRSVQVAHHANSRFAGAAPIARLVQAATLVEGLAGQDLTDIDEFVCRDPGGNRGACDGGAYLNEQGLSPDGAALVSAMMDRGMLVDVAHLSRRSLSAVHQMARLRSYPLLYSHAHMWDTVRSAEPRNEKYVTAEEIQMIAGTGGMVGLRTGPESTAGYGSPAPVEDRCAGSARSFAQSLMYAVDRGLTVGFGADLNGFIEQLKPRYSSPACPADVAEINAAGGPTELQRKGLAHVGLLPQLMADLQAVGVPSPYLGHLNRSAESFLQMWERSTSLAAGGR